MGRRTDARRRPGRPSQNAGHRRSGSPPQETGHCPGQKERWPLCRSSPVGHRHRSECRFSVRLRRERRRARDAACHRRLERLQRTAQVGLRPSRNCRMRRSRGCRGIHADYSPHLLKPEDLAERYPSRCQRQASASLPQRVPVPVQPPLLPV